MTSTTQPRARIFGAMTLAALAVGGLSACGPLDNTTFKDDATVASKITAVRVDGNADGFRIRGKQNLTKTAVHREVTYRGKTKPEGPTYRVENGVLVLSGCGNHCSVDYTVDVPAGIPVTGSTKAGSMNLSEVGAVKVSAEDGKIEVNGSTGTVDVRTTNGSIEAKKLRGPDVTAKASNGAVSLTPATAQNVTAQTTNGTVTVTVPPAKYHVSAQTQNGDKNLSIPDDPSAPFSVNLATDNGEVTLKPAK
ncbi:DUF4097 family beta strand repeat-containing protein [Streptomyces sp. NPDC048361]|uniref:DUF4097 family beta strand repeat-containing protein n=1 Tax=Streptomyces sp. NPDC048361 TaxID=3154720 RepID=UPI00344AA80A